MTPAGWAVTAAGSSAAAVADGGGGGGWSAVAADSRAGAVPAAAEARAEAGSHMHPQAFSRSDRQAAPDRRAGRCGAEYRTGGFTSTSRIAPSPMRWRLRSSVSQSSACSRLHERSRLGRSSTSPRRPTNSPSSATPPSTSVAARHTGSNWPRLSPRDLKAGDMTAALLNAIASLKATLEEHFPVAAAPVGRRVTFAGGHVMDKEELLKKISVESLAELEARAP